MENGIKQFKPLIGNIVLNIEDHVYKFDDVVFENQITVSTLVQRGKPYKNGNAWLESRKNHGLKIHEELNNIINGIDSPDYSDDTKAIALKLLEAVPNFNDYNLRSEVSFGCTDGTNYIFGTPDLIMFDNQKNYIVVEFKTSANIQSTHVDQVNLYKYLIAMELAEDRPVHDTLKGIRTLIITPTTFAFSDLPEESLAKLLTNMVEEYHLNTKINELPAENDDSFTHQGGGCYFAHLYRRKVHLTKELEKIEDEYKKYLEEKIPKNLGKYRVGNLLITRAETRLAATYNRALIEEKCPEAIINDRTTITTRVKLMENIDGVQQ